MIDLATISKLGEMIEEVEGTLSDERVAELWLIYEHAYQLTTPENLKQT